MSDRTRGPRAHRKLNVKPAAKKTPARPARKRTSAQNTLDITALQRALNRQFGWLAFCIVIPAGLVATWDFSVLRTEQRATNAVVLQLKQLTSKTCVDQRHRLLQSAASWEARKTFWVKFALYYRDRGETYLADIIDENEYQAKMTALDNIRQANTLPCIKRDTMKPTPAAKAIKKT